MGGYNGVKIIHEGFPSDSPIQQMVQYAYDVGGIDLVILIDCENGTRDPFRQSGVVSNGVREKSYGLCQISKNHHPTIINNQAFRSDRKTQIDYCNTLLQGGTKFYGPKRIIKGTNIQCKDYVLDRFTFVE